MKKVDAKRANEILKYYNYQGFGALCAGSKKPDVEPPTKEEKEYIWSTGNSGSDTLNSLLNKITKEEENSKEN